MPPFSVPTPTPRNLETTSEAPVLQAGHGVSIAVDANGATAAPITSVSADEIDRALAWRSVWLEFNERTLASVVDEFNQHNMRKLEVQDPAAGRILVTGSFRANEVETFVRLLESSFGVVVAATNDQRIVLRKAP